VGYVKLKRVYKEDTGIEAYCIVDLIEWGRSDSEEKVWTFGNVAELRAYTKETGKIFHNTLKQEGGNVVLRQLL